MRRSSGVAFPATFKAEEGAFCSKCPLPETFLRPPAFGDRTHVYLANVVRKAALLRSASFGGHSFGLTLSGNLLAQATRSA